MEPIRVLIVDDSAFMRKIITELLSSDSRIEVIGTARNGQVALKKIEQNKPDVVTLDVEMPIMDGITTLTEIMKNNPLPVVMFSSVTDREAIKTVDAISNGAVDFIRKPSGSTSFHLNQVKQDMINKVLMAANVNEETFNQKEIMSLPRKIPELKQHARTIIAIGTSTGGPRALQRILTNIPKVKNIPPILIVQHMPEKFTKSLAKRLNSLSVIEVKEAVHGDIIKENTAYIAPGNQHMRLHEAGTTCAIELSNDEAKNGHRPSVDVLFSSLSSVRRVNKVAIVLTGMGRDGAEGLKTLRSINPSAMIIAESKESAVIYGMPKAALHTGTVNSVIHLNQIGELISNLSRKTGEI